MRTQVLHSHRLVVALCLSISACSLLFETSQPSSEFDAGVNDDGGNNNPDASERACGISLSGTIGYFALDGESGNISLDDQIADRSANSVTGVGNTLVSTPLNTRSGPSTECGDAAALNDISGTFITLDNNGFSDAVSMDFWFQVDSFAEGGDRGVLLTKDGNGSTLGDLALFLIPAQSNPNNYRVLLRLQYDDFNNYYACSAPIVPQGVWNHVAVSLDAMDGATLFLNGVSANSFDEITIPLFNTIQCGNSDDPGFNVTLQDNVRDWMWGAAGYSTPNMVVRDGFIGAVDELRFRNQVFTASEALDVYNSVLLSN